MTKQTFLDGDAESDELNDKTRSELDGQFIELSEGVVHYELKGPADAQTVVLIHGNAAPYFSWDYNVPALLGGVKKQLGHLIVYNHP